MNAAPRHRLRGPAAALSLLLATAAFAGAPPQTVYRCGPDGRVYSQTPCADGQQVSVEDPRSAAQQRAAREVADREARSAESLAKERHQREAAVQGQQPIGIKPEPVATAASAAKSKSKSKPKSGKKAPPDANMSPVMRVPAPEVAPKQ